MKMREELELYKGRTAELEAYTARLIEEHELYRETQRDEFENKIRTLTGAHNVQVEEMTAKHTKAVESKDSTIKYRDDANKELTTQVNNLHDILDVIPGVLPREKEGQYGNSVNACHVRLASVLAQKFM